MKFTAIVALLVAAAAAVPTGIERRQLGMTQNDLKMGSCKKITLVYARGSTEMGNMVCMLIALIYQIRDRSSS